MPFTKKSLLLAVDSLKPGDGGVSRVARLMVKVLQEIVEHQHIILNVLAFRGNAKEMNLYSNFVSAKGSKLRFLLLLMSAAMRNRWFVFDVLGLCRGNFILELTNRPFLTWMHGIEVWEQARPANSVWAKRAKILLVNSHYTLARAQKIHGSFHNSHVCWLGTETDLPSTLDLPYDNCKTVTIIGRIDNYCYKGHFPLIQCWPDVVAKIPSARLLIVGTGPGMLEVQKKAANSSASRSIVFQGYVPEEQMDKIWKQTAILAMPSRGEGFGLVYIEAMRHGRPVIASIHDAASEVNIDGFTGLNVDLDLPGQLSAYIINLLSDQNKIIELGMNGKRIWKQHFCYTAFKRRFLSIFNDFIQR
jgi:phosphatidylinositol alpha-1,6-mannosyltransferase